MMTTLSSQKLNKLKDETCRRHTMFLLYNLISQQQKKTKITKNTSFASKLKG